MVNAWSLAYDVINGTLDENFPIMTDKNRVTPQESDEYDPKPKSDSEDTDWKDPVITVGSGNTASLGDFVSFDFTDPTNNVSIDTSNLDFNIDIDDSSCVSFASTDTVYADTWPHAETVKLNIPNVPKPGIQKDCTRKYKEDESIKALQDYISTTYGGHYTSDNNNVQTLDLIESVGDAESFCRSNAIKYLSRYDKKGQAKRDILKALHYSLLLYHFSGQLNETQTRGYETF